ncbi:MAG: sensor histidine kinase [Gaiellaceae bacterium]
MASALERTEDLLAAAVGEGEEDVLAAARGRARALLRAGEASVEAAERAALAFAGEALGLLLLEERFAGTVIPLVELLAAESPRPDAAVRLDLFRELLRSRVLAELPPRVAAEGMLRAAVSLGPLAGASLWQGGAGRGLECLCVVGENGATRRVRACAREVLRSGRGRDPGRGHVRAVPVLHWGATYAALVFRSRPSATDTALAYAGEAATHLSSAVERERLLRRAAAHERVLVEASERRLVRIGLDIHDGPLQVLATLVGDTHLLRDRLASEGDGGELRFLLAWLDDYAVRLREVDEALRELALSLESHRLRGGDLAVALRDEASAFAGRSGIEIDIDISGSFDNLTPSQRFALAAVVREALANVREHSSASRAGLRVRATAACIRASVVDDGRGFDVERALVAAAARGRLGLVGMSERIRLLGGHLAVESRPGGPTAITLTLPRWEPAKETTARAAAAAPAGR